MTVPMILRDREHWHPYIYAIRSFLFSHNTSVILQNTFYMIYKTPPHFEDLRHLTNQSFYLVLQNFHISLFHSGHFMGSTILVGRFARHSPFTVHSLIDLLHLVSDKILNRSGVLSQMKDRWL